MDTNHTRTVKDLGTRARIALFLTERIEELEAAGYRELPVVVEMRESVQRIEAHWARALGAR